MWQAGSHTLTGVGASAASGAASVMAPVVGATLKLVEVPGSAAASRVALTMA